MNLVSNVSDAILELNQPDEEIISIQTINMSFALGRHTPAQISGLQIESGDGKFILPAKSGEIVSCVHNTSFLDTQVRKKHRLTAKVYAVCAQ